MPGRKAGVLVPWKTCGLTAAVAAACTLASLLVPAAATAAAAPSTRVTATIAGEPTLAPARLAIRALGSSSAGGSSDARDSSAAGGTAIELPSGRVVTFALPPGGAMETAVPLGAGDGWLAAGTAPAPEGRGRDIILATGDAGGARASLPAPSRPLDAWRAEPQLLMTGGALAGLAWLEGESRQAMGVRFAPWNGSSWGATEAISPAAQGSQLALTAAHLTDGRWLLAWSGFDGRADQIVWSVGATAATGRGNMTWTAPQALTSERRPNITPALTATAGGGALVAWSQLAERGGYRLLVARFSGGGGAASEGDAGSWSAPLAVAAGGALYPSFEGFLDGDAGHPQLLYRDAARRGWAALDLDVAAAVRVVRVARSAGGDNQTAADRPVLVATGHAAAGHDGAAVFHWPAGADLSGAASHGADLSGAAIHGAGQADVASRWTSWTPPEPVEPAAAARPAGGATSPPGAARPKGPQTYIAFGDSITAGYGDSAGQGGYPGRLQVLLTKATNNAVTVVNAGLFGETTGEGLARLPSVLQQGASGLLLMEGTNDISARVSQNTTVANLDAMASEAEADGIRAYLATVIPRLASADFDPGNVITAALAGDIRELAWESGRSLIDPFEVFFVLTPDYTTLYLGGDDKLHPDPDGYTLLAQTFANVIAGIDLVPPVPGLVAPGQGLEDVDPNSEIEVDLYDFGAGIDLANTHLLVNGQVINITPTGDKTKLSYRYQPPSPLVGVINVGIDTQDLATPPNQFIGTLSQFIIAGTVFLQGDLNRDGIVDGLDLLLFAPCFGAHRYNTNFQLMCDLNGDGIIDGLDLALIAANFGKSSF